MFSEFLPEASRNLRWLYNHGYPKPASVKLVGDRYRLEKAQRQLLFRGVDSSQRAAGRRARIVSPKAANSCRLGVDGHNVVLTIANYLSGIQVFEADDGLIRDIGGLHGRLHNRSVMERSLDLTAAGLSELSPQEMYVVFDSPISHSGYHSGYLKEKLKEKLKTIDSGRINVETAASADRALKLADISLIATSDSALIEATAHPVLDLARMVLEENFQAVFDSFLPILTDL